MFKSQTTVYIFSLFSHSPAVRKISHECASEFEAYDKCLRLNPEDVTVCVDVLHKFMNCAQKSAQRIENAYVRQGKIQKELSRKKNWQ